MNLFRYGKILTVSLALSLGLTLSGCGSSGSNNDQGVAFTLTGFFASADGDDGGGTGGGGLQGISVPIAVPGDETQIPFSGAVVAAARVENNLAGQFIRLERIFLDYNIEGASVQPPSTSAPFSGVLGTATPIPPGSGGTTLPPDAGEGNVATNEFLVVPPAILEWLNLNRNFLPEAPFTMTVTARVSGVTSSGDRLTTNDLDLFVLFTPDIPIPPTEGDDPDDGSGSVGGDGGDDTGTSTGGFSDGSSVPEVPADGGSTDAPPVDGGDGQI